MGFRGSGFMMWSGPPLSTACYTVPKYGGASPVSRNLTLRAHWSASWYALVSYPNLSPPLKSFVKKADIDLFKNILTNTSHTLHDLLPLLIVLVMTCAHAHITVFFLDLIPLPGIVPCSASNPRGLRAVVIQLLHSGIRKSNAFKKDC